MKKLKFNGKIYIFIVFFAISSIFYFLYTAFHSKYLVVMPHFIIPYNSGDKTISKVDEFYNFIIKKYNLPKDINIVVISPIHFVNNYGARTYPDGNLCRKYTCLYSYRFSNFSLNSLKLYKVGNYYFTTEHGIGNHFSFLYRKLPAGNFYFISLDPMLNKNKLYELYQKLIREFFFSKTLFIFSIDSSHYVPENIALNWDENTKNILLNGLDFSKLFSYLEAGDIYVDCPSCLLLFYKLSKFWNKVIEFRYRDSSASIFNLNLPKENTSRMFFYTK